jgi:2-C-methyl-D-erythritol 4-phosphate cytidylyltransferase
LASIAETTAFSEAVFALITKIEKKSKQVIIGDSDPPFFKKTALEDIIFSISDKIDGQKRGLFLIEEK